VVVVAADGLGIATAANAADGGAREANLTVGPWDDNAEQANEGTNNMRIGILNRVAALDGASVALVYGGGGGCARLTFLTRGGGSKNGEHEEDEDDSGGKTSKHVDRSSKGREIFGMRVVKAVILE